MAAVSLPWLAQLQKDNNQVGVRVIPKKETLTLLSKSRYVTSEFSRRRKKIIGHKNDASFPLKEVIKTTMLEKDPPNHKIDSGLCLQPPLPFLNLKR